jgi:alanine racemase
MDFHLTLNKASTLINGSIHGNGEVIVDRLSVDSRTLSQSEGTLFIALVGEQHDGHNYISDLYKRGVRAFLISRLPDLHRFPDAGFCMLSDTLTAMQKLAAARRKRFSGDVLAITGSNGKTIVKEWIHQCLADLYIIHRSPKSYNSQVGVPLSVWGTGPEHNLAVIEAGISRPGEMERLQAIIRPRWGIFTNLGTAHQEHFGSLEEKFREKLKLFSECEKVIVRMDSPIGEETLRNALGELKARIVDWSLEGPASYHYRVLSRTRGETLIEAGPDGSRFSFILPFVDDASIENALHVVTFALEMGISPAQLTERITMLEPVSMRLEILKGVGDSILINDSYNSDIGGLSAALDLMVQQAAGRGQVVILSDLLQSGLEEEVLYASIASLLDSKGVELFIGIGSALCRQRSLFPDNSLFYPDTGTFLQGIDRGLFREKIILIKGSRKFGFESLSGELQLKTHQTRLETDLNALSHNLNYFRSLLDKGVETMVMVKALSYGIGNIEIAKLMQFHQVDYLAVAFIDEGVELRRAGIHLPVMVLNPDPGGFSTMIDYRLEPELYNLRGVKALQVLLHDRVIKGYPVHLKLDTGMHRLGFGSDTLEQALEILKQTEFQLASVFSHLAASDSPEHDDFTREQIRRFDRFCEHISASLEQSSRRHLLNSSGIERFPGAQYEMVRLGIGLHGIGSGAGLRPASAFKTTVSQVRKVSAGESIGYSRRGRTERDSLIAIIPIGYADGFRRSLGNGAGRVYIHGKELATIGDICMDMTMIDVSGTDIKEGDEVEIFGRQQTVSVLATQAGTIPYEILASIPERVKRVYLQE